MKEVHSLVFTEENCGDKLWKMVGEQIRLLCQADYVMTVKEEETGIVIIEYQHADRSFGLPYPYWLTEEDACQLSQNEEDEEE